MSNYPANLSPTDEHWNPEVPTANDHQVELESVCSTMKSEGLDGKAEAIMHYEGKETQLALKLRHLLINKAVDEGITPADLCLQSIKWGNVACFITALEFGAEYKYCSEINYIDSQQYQDMVKLVGSLQ